MSVLLISFVRHFVLAGQRGHVAMLDALRMEVVSEFHLRETVRDVKVSVLRQI